MFNLEHGSVSPTGYASGNNRTGVECILPIICNQKSEWRDSFAHRGTFVHDEHLRWRGVPNKVCKWQDSGRKDFEAMVRVDERNVYGHGLLWDHLPHGFGRPHESCNVGRVLPDCKKTFVVCDAVIECLNCYRTLCSSRNPVTRSKITPECCKCTLHHIFAITTDYYVCQVYCQLPRFIFMILLLLRVFYNNVIYLHKFY